MIALFIILFVAFIGLFAFIARKVIIDGKEDYLLIFFVLFLPVYNTLMIITYQYTGSPLAVMIIRYSKDLLVLISIVVFFYYRKDILSTSFRIQQVDLWFIAFLLLATFFAVAPIGPVALLNKLIYLKNIYFMGFAYFLGRNSTLTFKRLLPVLNIIVAISIVAFSVSLLEKNFNIHLQSLIGFTKYNFDINEIDPKGNYGLSWTFETANGQKRFASFFANPLEFSSAMLLGIATSFILFLTTPHKTNQVVYFLAIIFSIGCVYLAFSRSSFVAFFLLIFIASLMLRYYGILALGAMYFLAIVIYIAYFADDEVRYFVIDTITFQNPSSIGHLLDWLEAVESIVSSPQGIGLATSGNVGGVSEEVRVGGENQYLVFGVQMGVLGMFLYIGLLFQSIRYSFLAFRLTPRVQDKVIPFIATTVRFAFLLPLFTANAEGYIYLSLVTWWMIGYSIQTYNGLVRIKSKTIIADA